jgi:hypothetical protein
MNWKYGIYTNWIWGYDYEQKWLEFKIWKFSIRLGYPDNLKQAPKYILDYKIKHFYFDKYNKFIQIRFKDFAIAIKKYGEKQHGTSNNK